MKSFADIGVSSAAVRALARRGIEAPFAVQSLVIPDALAGHDVLAKSPTGSGKTLAFAIPVLQSLRSGDSRPGALVLAPTRELAGQIVDESRLLAEALGLSVAAVYGGVGMGPQIKAAKRAHMLVATPGRLLDLMARGAVDLSRIKMLVLDEADRMLDMGFLPDVNRIVAATPASRQTLFFSATLDGEAGRIARDYTTDARSHEHVPVAETGSQIEHRFIGVAHEAKLDRLVKELATRNRGDLALVFVRTKRGADRLVKRLSHHGVEAVAMHGDKTQGQRERALARFEQGKVDTLIATDVAARGIDVDGITHVINFDAPPDREGYVHRTGRTGRAGRDGVAITFVMSDQAKDMGSVARGLGLQESFEGAGFGAAHGAPSHAKQGPPRAKRNRQRRRRPNSQRPAPPRS